jgi:signal transduction histidine kinase
VTIRLRLAIAFGAGLLLTLVVAGAAVWWQMGQSLQASLQTALVTRAAGVLATIENNGQSGLQESDQTAPGVFAAVFSPAGQLLDSSSDAPAGLRPTGGVQALVGRQYLVRAETAADGSIVVTGADLQTVTDAQASLERALFGAGLATGLLSFLGSWFLSGRALRPLSRLTEDAAALDPSDLDRRLSQPARMDEVGRLSATLNAMLDRITESVEQQRLFVAMASHELRTPLASLRAELDIVERGEARLSDYRRAVREAQGDVIRLASLSTSLLDLASPGVDASAIARAPVNVRQLAAAVARSLEPVSVEHRAVVRLNAPDLTVVVDRTRIEHALSNLVMNAIVHGGPGEVSVNCRVEDDPVGRALQVEVLDRGPGIGDDPPEGLFDAFHRGTTARGSGSGLGLAAVAGAVRAHGGTYGAANRDGGGARFWFTVPCDAGEVTARSGDAVPGR